MPETNDNLVQFKEFVDAIERIRPVPAAPKPRFPRPIREAATGILSTVAARVRWPSRLLGPVCHLRQGATDYFGLPGAVSLFALHLQRTRNPLLKPPTDPELETLHEGIYLTSYSYGQFLLGARALREANFFESFPELSAPVRSAGQFLRDELEVAIAYRLAFDDSRLDRAVSAQQDVIERRRAFRDPQYATFGAIIAAATAANDLVTFPQLRATMEAAGLEQRVVDDQAIFFPKAALLETERFHRRLMPYVFEAASYVTNDEHYQGKNAIPFRGEPRDEGNGWVAALLCLADFLADDLGVARTQSALFSDSWDYALLNLFDNTDAPGALGPMMELSKALMAFDRATTYLGTREALDRGWGLQFAQHPWLGAWFVETTQFVRLQTRLMLQERELLPPGMPIMQPSRSLYEGCVVYDKRH